ncbi:hypothetical protein T492DRAFT_835062 [Pavlovales sp. CCMP2436]|nr:hypothetical protein T492DRAFT_835062 [Pavlovales sp. CCMP2436]
MELAMNTKWLPKNRSSNCGREDYERVHASEGAEMKLARARQCIIRRWRLKRVLRETRESAARRGGGELAADVAGEESLHAGEFTDAASLRSLAALEDHEAQTDQHGHLLGGLHVELARARAEGEELSAALELLRKKSAGGERRLRLALRSAEDELNVARRELADCDRARLACLPVATQTASAPRLVDACTRTETNACGTVGVQTHSACTLDVAVGTLRADTADAATQPAALVSLSTHRATQVRPAVASTETSIDPLLLLAASPPPFASRTFAVPEAGARRMTSAAASPDSLDPTVDETNGRAEAPPAAGAQAPWVDEVTAPTVHRAGSNPRSDLAKRVERDRQRMADEIQGVRSAHQNALQRAREHVRAHSSLELAHARTNVDAARDDAGRLAERVRRGMAQREELQLELRRSADRCAQLESARVAPANGNGYAAVVTDAAGERQRQLKQAILRERVGATWVGADAVAVAPCDVAVRAAGDGAGRAADAEAGEPELTGAENQPSRLRKISTGELPSAQAIAKIHASLGKQGLSPRRALQPRSANVLKLLR